ncbi:hypothetical protein CT19425_U610027 [Cupriavidus taiwanensis]|uniref:Uncharacterized protein n=1 Tax=Cupriavidus taiwanensis TaxID=164546 RepID=A0A375I9S3_9BURK|nr:hypothetical protein CT19425_U610027 [Cupriavidus taiwanensis]
MCLSMLQRLDGTDRRLTADSTLAVMNPNARNPP